MNNSGKIVNLVNPTNAQDAATRFYVDTATTTALGSSGTQANWPTVQRDDASNNTRYLTFIDSSDIPGDGLSKRALMRCDASLYYNPSTNTLTAGTFSGNLTGSAGLISAPTNSSTYIATDNTVRLWVESTGQIGIGTTAPAAPLHVASFNNISGVSGNFLFINSSSTTPYYNQANNARNISFISNNTIWCGGDIIVTSDQRIKTNIVNLNADKMINIFRNLRPISFDFIDPMKTNNNKKHFGFIAQEVNEILPEGISLNSDVIPNNMKKGEIDQKSKIETSFTLKPTDTDITLQYLLLTTDSPLIFDISNSYSSTNTYKFKVYCGGKPSKEHDIYIRSDYNVTDDKYTYVIGMKKEAYDVTITEPTLFVYGQYVYDLHILDRDTIYTVATAALQEVDRQQQADKARIAELENQVSNQQSLINDILERLKTLEKV